MNPIYFGRIIFLTLLFMEIIILFFRFSSSYYKREFILFLLIIIFLALKTFFSHLFFVGIGASLILVYVTGNFIYTLIPGKFNYLWTISVGLVAFIVVVLMILNLTSSIYFSFFYLYSTAILFLYPLRQMWRVYHNSRSGIFLYLFITSIMLIFARALDIIGVLFHLFFIDLTLWISICLIAGLGYMIFQKGYLINSGIVEFKNRFRQGDLFLHSLLSRIVETEDTRFLQDRLIATGLLSAGTSHEFKNILTRIKTLSQYGLRQRTDIKKDDVFKAILENTTQGVDFILKAFDRIGLRMEEKPKKINIKKDLVQLFKLIRISYRREGIRFRIEIDDNLQLKTGKGELEQVLVNLITNAADSLMKKNPEEKNINIKAYGKDSHVVIDIIDNGEGVPAHLHSTIFEPQVSLKGSSGLGLYLVKMLVDKNHGNIECLPNDTGAFFRLIFPVCDEL